ncbi:MAG TPA: Trm112 family protein, partial [Longimicrobium sp.]|nr:Trm112 family protein [Longimicrobium sp.]
MHILLTDLLTCPRCGPEHGLVLLADRIEERRVVRGRLGCPNCRETYPVAGTVADLRVAGAGNDAPS